MAVPQLIAEFAPGAGPLDQPAPDADAENFLRLDGGGWAETAADASLDLTTTFDIRLEIAAGDFTPAADQALAGRWEPSEDDTSWLLLLTTTGALRLVWHDAATGEALERTSTQVLPTVRPRLAVRVAGDVSIEGPAVTFFTADSIAGPWVQLGDILAGGGGVAVGGGGPLRVGAFDPGLQVDDDEEPTEPGEPPPLPEPEVIFFDDFTTAHPTNRGLDPDVWFVHNRPGTDEGYVNNEWQLYLDDQVSVEGGLLRIRAEHVGGTGPGSYHSGLVTTAGKLHFGPPSVTGGLRLEIRLRAPGSAGNLQGLWPSLYMLEDGSADHFGGTADGFPGGSQIPPGWPTTGKSEVDVWEWAGAVHGVFTYHVNRHWNTVPNSSQPGKGDDVDTSPNDMTQTFNTYGVVWTEDYLAFEYNGVEVHRLTGDDTEIPVQAMFPIINFACGGFFPGDPDPDNFPTTYEVDWIKVTQLLPTLKVALLTDDLAPPRTVWTASAEADQVTVTGGGVEVALGPNYPSYRTISRGWDLTTSSVFVEVGEVPAVGNGTTQAFLTLTLNHVEGAAPPAEIRIGWNGGVLVGEHQTDQNYVTEFEVAYDETNHRYWRISEAGGTLTYATSPDGQTWTTRGSVPTGDIGFSPTALDVELQAGHFGVEAAPGTFRVEGVNIVGDDGGTDPGPGPGDMPDETNTGLTDPGALSPAGFDRITSPGVYENLEFGPGYVEVQADNVTFRNCLFHGPSSREAVLRLQAGRSGMAMEDCEVDGHGPGSGVGVAYGGYTLRRCYIHDCQDGIKLGDDTTVEDCYVADLAHEPGAHNDGMQSSGGNNITVRRCHIINEHSQTSAILIGADLGNIDNVLIQGNWLESHANFVLTVGADPGWSLTNCVIRDNKIAETFTTGVSNFSEDQDIDFFDNEFYDGTPIPDRFLP